MFKSHHTIFLNHIFSTFQLYNPQGRTKKAKGTRKSHRDKNHPKPNIQLTKKQVIFKEAIFFRRSDEILYIDKLCAIRLLFTV